MTLSPPLNPTTLVCFTRQEQEGRVGCCLGFQSLLFPRKHHVICFCVTSIRQVSATQPTPPLFFFERNMICLADEQFCLGFVVVVCLRPMMTTPSNPRRRSLLLSCSRTKPAAAAAAAKANERRQVCHFVGVFNFFFFFSFSFLRLLPLLLPLLRFFSSMTL